MNGGWWQYAGVFVATSLMSLLLTPLAMRLAFRTGVMDDPEAGEHKSHAKPVPYLGGLAIVVSFAVAVVVAALVDDSALGEAELVKVLGMAVGLAVLGLIDDLRSLPPFLRLVAEIGAGVAIWQMDLGVGFTGTDITDGLVTVLWVVGITNAFNLLDNMDGLSAGLTAIAASSFFAIAASNGQYLVGALSIGVAGCALGFLRHNFHPAKIYMGDAGALFFGFMLSYLGLKLQFGGPQEATFLVPVVVCSIAILDTSLVTITRLMAGRSPFQGGRDHVSHRLVRIGLPVPAAVTTIYLAAASAGTIALVIGRVDATSAAILASLIGTLTLTAGTLLARITVVDVAYSRVKPTPNMRSANTLSSSHPLDATAAED